MPTKKVNGLAGPRLMGAKGRPRVGRPRKPVEPDLKPVAAGNKPLEPRKLVTDEEIETAGYPSRTTLKDLAAPLPPAALNEFRPSHIHSPRRILGQMIRELGAEVIDTGLGWSRLEVVVRALYAKAMTGDVVAARELLDRGWGRVPTPVELDLTAQVQQLMVESGVTWSEAAGDPLLNAIFAATGVIDGAINGQRPSLSRQIIPSPAGLSDDPDGGPDQGSAS